jgi:hypothetical protein
MPHSFPAEGLFTLGELIRLCDRARESFPPFTGFDPQERIRVKYSGCERVSRSAVDALP